MPDPIMEPMTSVVASSRPRPLMKPVGQIAYCNAITPAVRLSGSTAGEGLVGIAIGNAVASSEI